MGTSKWRINGNNMVLYEDFIKNKELILDECGM